MNVKSKYKNITNKLFKKKKKKKKNQKKYNNY